MKTIFNRKYGQWIFGLPLIILIIYSVYSYQKFQVNYIENDCSFVIGRIKKVHDGGVAFDLSLDYEYMVGNQLFSRTVQIQPRDKVNFRRCLRVPENCLNYFVWVIYSNTQPNKSLVNLTQIYSEKAILSISTPLNHDGFY